MSTYSQGDMRESLENLFIDWREFEKPPLFNGAPDYRSNTFDLRIEKFNNLRNRLNQIDREKLDVKSQVDWTLIWAEMNGFEFNYKILKPWERDPAFYKSLWMNRSDVPAHEGPTHHMVVEVWQYDFPLSKQQLKKLTNELSIIPEFNQPAKTNLTGNARDLWIAGIRDIDTQVLNLESLKNFPGVKKQKDLIQIIDESISSTKNLSKWLKDESKNKTGPSGIGKTTLVRTIAGLVRPRQGSFELHLPSQGGLGYIPQRLGLVRHASVYHNVNLGARASLPLLKGKREERNERVISAVSALGLK